MSDAIENNVEQLTLESLDASVEGLGLLSELCLQSAECLVSDLAQGVALVPGVADNVYDFIVFEQQVVDIFNIDTTTVQLEEQSMAALEEEMHETLEAFGEKLDAMDLVGVADLLRERMAPLLQRFSMMIPVLRTHIDELISSTVDA